MKELTKLSIVVLFGMVFMAQSNLFANAEELKDDIIRNKLSKVKKYIAEGGSPNIKIDREFLVEFALDNGKRKIAKYLLSQKNIILGPYILNYACIGGDTGIIKTILNKDGQKKFKRRLNQSKKMTFKGKEGLREQDRDWRNENALPIHIACWNGKKGIVKFLVSKGADVNAKTKSGKTPLHYAAKKGRQGIVSYLLSKGAEKDAQDKEGMTPLHYAGYLCNLMTYQTLKSKGANTSIKDKYGKKSWDYAKKNCGSRFVQKLLKPVGL